MQNEKVGVGIFLGPPINRNPVWYGCVLNGQIIAWDLVELGRKRARTS